MPAFRAIRFKSMPGCETVSCIAQALLRQVVAMLLKNATHRCSAMHVTGQTALDLVAQPAILSTAAARAPPARLLRGR